MSDAAVRVDSVAKTYRSGLFRHEVVHALDDVSLSVEPGTIFGLLGPNGAGKTTLVKILLSIVTPTAGQAMLFGRPVDDPGARLRIGFLPEKHRFPDFLTADQMLHLYGRLSGVPADERTARIPDLLERVGMTKWQNTKIKKYSKGMLQRVGIAQALMNDPDLVFLDEPTDGVDPVGRREIRDILVWMREQGKTVFLNSHLLSEVEKVCSNVAILNEGKLVRQGTIDELTTVDRVYDLTTTPVPNATLEELGDALQASSNPPTSGNGLGEALEAYRVVAEDRATLNHVLDRLRAADVQIEAVQPLRRTLEDYFIDVVGQQESTSATRSEPVSEATSDA